MIHMYTLTTSTFSPATGQRWGDHGAESRENWLGSAGSQIWICHTAESPSSPAERLHPGQVWNAAGRHLREAHGRGNAPRHTRRLKPPLWVSERVRGDRCFLSAALTAGQAGGEAERDVPADAGAAADGGAVAQAGAVQAGGREEEPRRVHEEERRVHQPAGEGTREVSVCVWESECQQSLKTSESCDEVSGSLSYS